MRIGELAKAADTTVRAVRYYEEQQLLRSMRSTGGHRQFPADAVDRVRLIQHFLAAGLSSATIRDILPAVDRGSATPAVLELLRRNRDEIASRIVELLDTQARLDEVIANAEQPCDHSGPLPQPGPRRRVGRAS